MPVRPIQYASGHLLSDNFDVDDATPSDGHVLTWDNGAQEWEPAAPVTGDSAAIHDNVAGEIDAVTLKTAPAAADALLVESNADANAKRKILFGTIPRDTLLAYEGTADGAAISQHTTATADRTTATRAWNFVLDGATYDSIYGSGGWKVVALVRGKTQNGADNFKASLYNVDAAAVIGTDGATVVGTAYDDMTFTWSTGLPSTKVTCNFCYYNNPGSTGHLSYLQNFQLFVRAA